MPYGQTYSSLVTSMQDYLQRYDTLITKNIPQFIFLAQQRIPRELKLLGFKQIVTGVLNGSALTDGILAKPADWRKTINFFVGTGAGGNVFTPVFERDSDYIRQNYPDPSQTGTPRFYGDEDFNHWVIGPVPSAALNFRIGYYGTLTLLDITTQTNWLTINAPDLLLYASLLEAAPFVKTDERIPVWQGLYTSAKVALQAQDREGRFDTAASVGEPQEPSVANPR